MIFQTKNAIEEKVEKLLSVMTVEEKVGQMLQISANAMPEEIFESFKEDGKIGSYLHILGEETGEFIKSAEQSRLKIPPIFGIDAIHGHALLKQATVFPTQLAMACSWDMELVERVGEITACEVDADGLNWVFSPVLCLGRDLRWGRVDETFGEDPELCARLGAAIIRGYQKSGRVAACAKHYLGYGEATGGRDSYNTDSTERKAREILLKPFKAAVDEGCMTFMTAYGSMDGEPLTISRRYLTEILKEEYGFDGFVVTDWENFRALVNGQKVCENMDEACVEGVVAGNDMSMNSYEFFDALVLAVKEGRISESVINNAVKRILSVKARLGLLDKESERKPDRTVIGCDAHQDFNLHVALKSTVLLKNNGTLPIKEKRKIVVLGPNADDIRAQYGDWTYFTQPGEKPWETPKESSYTILKGIKEIFNNSEVVYSKGCSVENTDDQDTSDKLMEEALMTANDANVAVIVIGDVVKQNGEQKDRACLELSGRQNELVRRIKGLNKQVVVVLVNGKPLVLNEIEKYADAIVETFNGGDMSGLAVAKLLKGEENFSGKLPISFPYSSSSLPCYYNQYDYWHGGKYIDVPKGSPFPFGFGLSYSRFIYEKAYISKTIAKLGESIEVSVEIKNDSALDGIETVQLYFKDVVCKRLTPVRTLIDFKSVFIPKGERRAVSFSVDTEKLGYFDGTCNYRVDAGEFIFYISGDGKNFKELNFRIEN